MRIVYTFIIFYFISTTSCKKPEHESLGATKDEVLRSHRECNTSQPKKHDMETAGIAQKAAQDAKAAESAQLQAGQQAAHQVKEELAEKAVEAAKAAEAALAGKENLVDDIQQELKESEMVASEEAASLQQFKQTVDRADKALEESRAEEKLLQTAMQLSHGEINNAQQALEGDEQQIKEKEQLVDAAKSRTDALSKQLCAAKSDLLKTRDAARKAETAASEAKVNVSRNKRKLSKKNIRK